MLESKMASQQRDVEHILQLLTGKKCEENDDSQVFDKLPTSKIQIIAYVEYFGQFTSEQFLEDIAEHISQFNEEAHTPFLKKYKTLIHPGEVNRIRELPQKPKIVATHTDSPDVLIWDVEAQPNRHAVLGVTHSCPYLILTVHQDNAEFALAMCPTEPYVISGGKDKSVVLWSIQDHISGPHGIFYGHEDTVEDVAFSPSSAQEFCSVGDDSYLILWDARVGTSPVVKILLFVCLIGINLTSNGVGSVIHKFEGHKAVVLCFQWSPDKSSVLGSSAEDGLLTIWDYDKVGKKIDRPAKSPSTPAGLFFQQAGQREQTRKTRYNIGSALKNLAVVELRTMVHSLFLESCASIELASGLLFIVLTVCVSHEAQFKGSKRPRGEESFPPDEGI
ncbi:WD-40 repeat-containing protein MSI4 [Hibiscus syriacus]|uniref:WD-40 repeat-containing protein MSI4 n=1 Tax=Hibiscus syriacus TaxID=106335 RepID=A0A6A2YUN3_HIBSY|nr:WD-40 repeat-containing protein MSI4 [Hibiscus syriacus]